MKKITVISAGVVAASVWATSAFAHSGAGAPHVHFDHVVDSAPAHIAGLAVLAMLAISIGGLLLIRRQSKPWIGKSRSKNCGGGGDEH